MIKNLGPVELIIILSVFLLLFGVGRVSRVGKELGTAISEFKKGLSDDSASDDSVADESLSGKSS